MTQLRYEASSAKNPEGPQIIRLSQYKPTAGWFLDTLSKCMRTIARKPKDKSIQTAAIAIAKIATAAKGYMDQAALEKRIQELEEAATAMSAAERHGMITGAYGPSEPKRPTRKARKDLGSESSIH